MFSATSNITLPLVPPQAVQSNIIWYNDLETTVNQLPGYSSPRQLIACKQVFK